MKYENIVNKPYERRRVTNPYVWWENGFNEKELESIIQICEHKSLTPAATFGDNDRSLIEQIRRSKVNFVERTDETAWIFSRFNGIIDSLNAEFYGFELNGYSTFQYTVYDAEDKGMYDWHMDMLMSGVENDDSASGDTRKLTLVLVLSQIGIDYVGGEFELNLGLEERSVHVPINKGKIIAFPSWMIHRVKPVIRGVRKSIVIWVEGPKFK
jgi:PKHD-type hydroxylase